MKNNYSTEFNKKQRELAEMEVNWKPITINPTPLAKKPKDEREVLDVAFNINTRVTVSIDGFIEYVVGNPAHAFVPAIYGLEPKPGFKTIRSQNNWIKQEVIVLDIDGNVNGDVTLNPTPEQTIEKCKGYGIDCNVIYTTSNHLKKYDCNGVALNKYRVVFFLDEAITKIEDIKRLNSALKVLFPEADVQCFDLAHMFYGGPECVYVNYDLVKLEDLRRLVNPIIYALDKDQTRNSIKGEIVEYPTQEHFDFELLYERVRIWRDFMDGKELKYMNLYHLASNLRVIKGGILLMKQTMEHHNEMKNTSYKTKDFNCLKDATVSKYAMSSMSKISPYAEDHQYGNIITAVRYPRGLVEIISPRTFITLEESDYLLQNAFNSAMLANDKNVYVIKACVGAGKTRISLNAKRILRAYPTNALKNEVYEKRIETYYNNELADTIEEIRTYNEYFQTWADEKITLEDIKLTQAPIILSPDAPVFSDKINVMLETLYKNGLHRKASGLIKDISNDIHHEKYSANDFEIACNYLSGRDLAFATKNEVFTTHHSALHNNYANQDTILFDEDILPTLFPINTVELNELNRLCKAVVNDDALYDYINHMFLYFKDCTDVEYIENEYTMPDNLVYKLAKYIIDNDINGNLLGLLSCSHFIKQTNEKTTITYISKTELPSDKKIIILSATADYEVYKMLAGDRLVFSDFSNVKQQGKIEVYTKYSFSGSYMLNHVEKVAKRKEQAKELDIDYLDDSVIGKINKWQVPVITHKRFKHLLVNSSESMHMGNVSGYDLYKGLDLVVAATPHPPMEAICLTYLALGGTFTKEEAKIEYIITEYKGKRFKFNTFIHEGLRNVQFYFIDGGLVQAVGRSRTVRTDAKVIVLTNYPIDMDCEYIREELPEEFN